MIELKQNIPLSRWSNLKVGGPARYFTEPDSIEELKRVLETARQIKQNIYILGGGTNILWGDEGFNGLVIKPKFDFINREGNLITVGAGTLVDKLVDYTLENSLAGLDWAGGLPGTVGGAVFGNAGCFGGEMKDNLVEVLSLDTDSLQERRRSNKDCAFDYRESVFKKNPNKEIIVQATIEFGSGDAGELRKRVEEERQYRRDRQPLEYPNLGSFFKNVDVRKLDPRLVDPHRDLIKTDPFPVIPAAHLIHAAELKGLQIGGALVSPKHPNFLINVGDAKTSDFLELIETVKKTVKDKFGIELEEEVRRVITT